MAKDLLKSLREAKLAEAIELGKPLQYEMDSVSGAVVGHVPGIEGGVTVNVSCEFTSNGVYDSQEGWLNVKAVTIKSFKILGVEDEFDVVPEGMMQKVTDRVMKDKNAIQRVLQDRLMQGEELR